MSVALAGCGFGEDAFAPMGTKLVELAVKGLVGVETLAYPTSWDMVISFWVVPLPVALTIAGVVPVWTAATGDS